MLRAAEAEKAESFDGKLPSLFFRGTVIRARLACHFCGQATREHDLIRAADINWLVGLYLTHLVESHWAELEALHGVRVMLGGNYDAWQRL